MRPRIKIGLIVGGIGLILNCIVAAAFGVCGPLLALAAGATAGYIASQQEKPPSKADGARLGATAGGIAGALVFVGQIVGAIGVLAFFQVTGIHLPFGNAPAPSSDAPMMIAYYLSGLGVGICFGTLGIGAAALGGGGAGYLATPSPADPRMMA
jgi:hypothetical protein